jgi:hypothetical protein
MMISDEVLSMFESEADDDLYGTVFPRGM